MDKVIFGLLSLVLTFFDVKIGLMTIRELYGPKAYSLALSPEFLIFYVSIVFMIEYYIISAVSTKILHFLKQ
ncbi:hypothetical protein [Stygiolobus caldivivus]|uniref:Uncharacterized protein n=1 Tax=Stygiolobus caldivivus TaxID=2824673 RepID=A0A8D5U7Z9_9CREN|nr:hypothetical protein [Stygiolobus caldivivus]BCU70434.1 hypothetical protein KN1_17310 [Stygiolobus caldivivus]